MYKECIIYPLQGVGAFLWCILVHMYRKPVYKKRIIYTLKGVGDFLWCILVHMYRKPVFSAEVCIVVQINVARNAFCAATAIPLYMTLFALGQLLMTNLGLMCHEGFA